MDFRVIIPARYASTRLPGKVLLDIAGKPMLQHVYERAIESGAQSVVIATDDEQVAQAAKKFHAHICMTASDHKTGTDRLAEAVIALDYEKDDIVVCLQADEPLIPSKLITQLAQNLEEHDHAKVATMAKKITDPEELFNPHVVKVTLNHRSFALYFSRAPIPWERDKFHSFCDEKNNQVKLTDLHYRHIGIYAYRAGFLETYSSWPACSLEHCESLEQLRILWNGYKIHVGITDLNVPVGVDTEDDLQRVREKEF